MTVPGSILFTLIWGTIHERVIEGIIHGLVTFETTHITDIRSDCDQRFHFGDSDHSSFNHDQRSNLVRFEGSEGSEFFLVVGPCQNVDFVVSL